MLRTNPLFASLFITTACVANGDPVGVVTEARISPNGTSANGINLNGVSLTNVAPLGLRANATPIGSSRTGAPLSGAGIIHSLWSGQLSNGTRAALRIDDVLRGSGANTDVWSYRVSVFSAGSWQPLCRDAAGHSAFADSVQGTWNLAQGVPGGGSYNAGTASFTLACRGSAIAKCIELGYKPWTGRADELAACVRALRADYCGDGVSYTVDGTLVNIFDTAGLVPDDAAWQSEAAWTPGGAACISSATATRFSQAAHQVPSCYPHALEASPSCGADFTDGVQIITELPLR
jgi:hypothetical protein